MPPSADIHIRRLKTTSSQQITLTKPDVAAKIELTLQTISDPSRILENGEDIDAFANKWSKNPFLLSGFISQFITSNRLTGWIPFVLVVKADKKIVGTAPLMIKKRLGMRFVRFFPNFWFSPDFVVDERYREVCMDCIVEYLFKSLNCRFASFCLPFGSQNLETLKKYSKVSRMSFSAKNQPGHCVLPIESSWNEFQEKKGRRRIIRQIERKLNQIGPWKIEYIQNVYNRPDVKDKILEVEQMSWKESWRNGNQIAIDEELLMIWEGSQIEAKTKTDFKSSVWLLQIDSETVAYAFVIKHKQTAFIVKTSFNKKYRKFYVGKYIINAAIRDLFNEDKISAIDFMTDLPFMSFWSPLSLCRVDVNMSKGNFATSAQSLSANTNVPQVLNLF